VRVSTEKQADLGVSLEAQTAKIRPMAVVQGAEFVDVLVDAGESAKSLQRPGMTRLLALVDTRAVDTVIIAKLDHLTRSVADLAELLKRFERRGVSLVSVADALDTRSAAGRLVLNIMVSVSQWEREAIGERSRDAMRHKKAMGESVGTVPFGSRRAPDNRTLTPHADEQRALALMPPTPGRGAHVPRDCGGVESAGAHDAPWHRVAAPVRGQRPQSLLMHLSRMRLPLTRSVADRLSRHHVQAECDKRSRRMI
jgi:DNA invertase Pin-like site-specific DNA recombinase